MLAVGTGFAAEEVNAPVSYATITETCDWGAMVTKLVLHFNEPLSNVIPEMFRASVVRNYVGTEDLVQQTVYSSMTEYHFETSPTAAGERTIENAYLSDAEGNPVTDTSDYVTLEMLCSPEEGYGNILGVDVETNSSIVLDCKYTVIYTDESGTESVCTTKDDEACKMLITDRFTHGQTYDDLTYASYEPSDDEIHPLVIWLHGAGEGGTDTRVPLLGNKATAFADEEFQSIMGGAYVLVPQTPTFWMTATGTGYDLTAENPVSFYTEPLMGLIESYVTAHPGVDKDRIYIGGCSNGGYMTVNMLIQYPDYFAAAFPVCEAYTDEFISDEQIALLAGKAIWFTQAQDDNLVAPDAHTIPTYKRLKEAGAQNVHFTFWTNVHDLTGKYNDENGDPIVYPFSGHDSWRYLLNNLCTIDNDYQDGVTTSQAGDGQTIFEWLAEQSL